MKKNSLNEIDDDSSDGDLSTNEMLEKYEKVKDSSADPDYVPSSGEELSSEEFSSEVDTEEEKTESQKQLNGERTKFKLFTRTRSISLSFEPNVEDPVRSKTIRSESVLLFAVPQLSNGFDEVDLSALKKV